MRAYNLCFLIILAMMPGFGQTLVYSPSSLTFPATPLNSSSAEQIVKITNKGTAPAVFSDYFVPSNYSINYTPATSVTPGCGPQTDAAPNLAGGASCAIGITYNPTSKPPTAPFGNNLAIDLCPPCTGTFYNLPLNATTGNGPVLKFSPTQLIFPATPAGGTSATIQVTVTNVGNAVATISQMPTSTVFVLGGYSCVPNIPAGGTCTMPFTFRPPATSTVGSVLSADSTNATPNALNVVLQGGATFSLNATGTVSAAAPAVTTNYPNGISTTAPAGAGDTLLAPAVVITNSGNAALTISDITASDPAHVVLDKLGNCRGGTFQPNATCTFDVYFRPPATAGVTTATIDIASNAGKTSIPFTGTASAPNNNPAVTITDSRGGTVGTGQNGLSFIQNINTSQTQNITVTNSGKSDLTISNVVLSDPTYYRLTNDNCLNAVLHPGNPCTISVLFAPVNYGPATATVTLTDNAPPGTQQITLNGNGTGPAILNLSSRSKIFSTAVGGPPPPVATITIANTGGSDANITYVGHSNTDGGFVIDSASCQGQTLHPQWSSGKSGYQCQLLVSFKPDSIGDAGDVVAVVSDAPSNPDLIILFGSGTCGAAVQCAPPPFIPTTRGYHTLSLDAVADPVDGATGDFYETKSDLHVGGPVSLDFARYYSSGLSIAGYVSSLGTNWMHNYDVKVASKGTNAQVILFGGRIVSFSKASGSWKLVSPLDTGYQLADFASGFQFMNPVNRLINTFDSAGRLTGISNLSGYTLTVAQGDYGPTQVSDGQGRTLTFTYANNLLASVQDQGGRTVSFAYDPAGTLISATAPDKAVTTYSYTTQGSSIGLMVKKQLPGGNVLTTQTFDSSGKVVKQADANGNNTTVSYDGKGGTTIKSPLGAVTGQSNDINGDIAGLQDPAGNSGKFTYDNSFRRTSITDRLGNTIGFTYHDPTGKLASLTDEAGNTTSYTYTPFSQGAFTFYNLTGIQYADGSASSFTYDAGGRMTGQVQRDGTTKAFTYDDKGRVTSSTGVDGGTSTYAYNPDSTIASTQDALGNTTSYGYAASKQIASITDANGGVQSFTYDAAGRMSTLTDPLGNVSSVHYNANGQRDKWTVATGGAYTFGYDAMNRIAQYGDPLGNKTNYAYDADGRPLSITNGAGETSKFTYDAVGHVVSLANNGGVISTYSYDAEGRLVSRSDANGAKASYTYGPTGNLAGLKSPAGNQWTMAYDKFGLLISATNPLGEIKSLTRDAMGRVIAINLPGGIGTTTQLNARGQAAAITSPNGNAWTINHDALGRVSAITDPLGNATTRSYTGNFITGMTFPLGSVNFTNDSLGRVVKRVYSDGTVYNMAYDSMGMLASSDGVSITRDAKGLPKTVNGLGLTYNAADHPASITYAPGKTVTYGYDADGHVTSVSDWVGGRTTIAYDPAGRPTSVTYPNGIATSYSYDADGHVTGIAAGSIASIQLTRDADGKVLSADRNLPAQPALQASSEQLTYDAAGRLATSDASFVASFDNMGRALGESGRTYSWNLANQLTGFNDGTNSVALTYDGLGEVNSSTATGSQQSFVFNHAADLPALSIVRQGGSDLRYYVYLPNGKLLYSVEAGDSSRKFYHFDEMGNTTFLTGDDGSVTDTYAITPYGDVADHVGQQDNPFTWQGQYGVMQEAAGLYFLRGRHYDAILGRFLSPDPEIQSDPRSAEPYIYARGNPLMYIDPYGDLSWGDVGNFLGGVGSAVVNGAKAAGTALVNAGQAAVAAVESAGAKVGSAIASLSHPAAAPASQPPSPPPGPVVAPPSVLMTPAPIISNSAALRLCKKSKTIACPDSLIGALQRLVDAGDGSMLIGQDGSGLIGQDGSGLLATLIGQDGAGIVSHDGGTVVSHDGGSVVSHDGGSIVSHDGGTVISNDGGSVISNDGGSLIGSDGASIIAQGAGNVIAQGAGNVIAQGGGNVIAQGAGNVIAQGAGN